MIFFHHSTHLVTDGVVVVVAGLTLAGSIATQLLLQEAVAPTFTNNVVLIITATMSLVTAITVMVGSLVGLVKVISELKKITVKQDEAAVQAQATHGLVNSQGEEMRRQANALGISEGIAQEKAESAVTAAAEATTVLAVAAAVEQERQRLTSPVVPAEVVVVNPDPVEVIDVKSPTLHRRKPPAAKG